MDENLPVNPGTQREDSFDIAVRGYNRQQVMEYMARSSQLLTTLEQHLSAARAEVQRARAAAEAATAEADELRAARTETKPVHAEVSDRLSQILRLAAEEADQERSKAVEEITKLRSETQAETERLLGDARAEAERDLAEARETAERELTEARETATTELATARETATAELDEARSSAEHQVASAREEADRLRLESVRHAEDLLDDAQRRAGAVNDVSNQRLETLTATHGEAVLRLGQIRDVLADLLDRDAAAGSLSQVVEAVMAPHAVGAGPEGLTDGLDAPELEGELDDDELDVEAVDAIEADSDEVGPVDGTSAFDDEEPMAVTEAPASDELADLEPVEPIESVESASEPAEPAEPAEPVAPDEIDLREPHDDRLVAGRAGVPIRR